MKETTNKKNNFPQTAIATIAESLFSIVIFFRARSADVEVKWDVYVVAAWNMDRALDFFQLGASKLMTKL